MVSFGDLPFRRKLTVIIMATSSATVLLACVAFVTHDLLSSDLHEIRGRFFRDLGIGALVLLVCSFAAWLLSSRLQRLVSEPVLQLVQTARTVSELKDFSVRARKEHDD
ncbi:MAG TPA: hypothetical protein VE078_09315, partial [Thermoanaerobaculia bacterium]|nr:hypothetical protein [Thermoanaerobaculia bacterium]